MTERIKQADAATRARLKELHETPMSQEEFQRRLAEPISDDEREQMLEPIAWFKRRYPTPTDRLLYARRAYRRWMSRQE